MIELQVRRMMIIRKVSIEKIPKELAELPLQVWNEMRSIFGDTLLGLYGSGSWVRGEMRTDSDIDFYYIVKTKLTSGQEKALDDLKTSLLTTWHTRSVKDLDIKPIYADTMDHWHMIVRRVILEVDGCHMFGSNIPGDTFSQYTTLTIAKSFSILFSEIFKALRLYDENEVVRKRARRLLSKIVLRCMDWVAILHGAPLSSSIPLYVNDIKNYTSINNGTVDTAWNLYQKINLTDEDVMILKKLFTESLSTLKNTIESKV
jgi:predicted nucleotidyltransferase